jgi:tetrahydromethanopterin S-methyltransferase subunit G
MDEELRGEFKKIDSRFDGIEKSLNILDDIAPVVYGLEEKVETILERVNELGRLERLDEKVERMRAVLREKLGVEV